MLHQTLAQDSAGRFQVIGLPDQVIRQPITSPQERDDPVRTVVGIKKMPQVEANRADPNARQVVKEGESIHRVQA